MEDHKTSPPIGEPYRHRTGQNRDVGQSVTEVVDQQRAKVQITIVARQQQRDAPVYGQGHHRKANHPLLVHRNGIEQPLPRLPEQAGGYHQQQNGIGEGRQNSRAAIAESSLGIGGTGGPAQGEPRDNNGGNVGEIMDGVAGQSDGMAEIGSGKLRNHQGDRRQEGPGQNRCGGPAVRMACARVLMDVHSRIVLPAREARILRPVQDYR
jgi:hypothetical protein